VALRAQFAACAAPSRQRRPSPCTAPATTLPGILRTRGRRAAGAGHLLPSRTRTPGSRSSSGRLHTARTQRLWNARNLAGNRGRRVPLRVVVSADARAGPLQPAQRDEALAADVCVDLRGRVWCAMLAAPDTRAVIRHDAATGAELGHTAVAPVGEAPEPEDGAAGAAGVIRHAWAHVAQNQVAPMRSICRSSPHLGHAGASIYSPPLRGGVPASVSRTQKTTTSSSQSIGGLPPEDGRQPAARAPHGIQQRGNPLLLL